MIEVGATFHDYNESIASDRRREQIKVLSKMVYMIMKCTLDYILSRAYTISKTLRSSNFCLRMPKFYLLPPRAALQVRYHVRLAPPSSSVISKLVLLKNCQAAEGFMMA